MKKINRFEKITMVGQGGVAGIKRKYTRRSPVNKKQKYSYARNASSLKKWDNISHNLGMAAMTLISSGSTIFDSVADVLDRKDKQIKRVNNSGGYWEDYENGSYYSDNSKKTYISASQSIRPH